MQVHTQCCILSYVVDLTHLNSNLLPVSPCSLQLILRLTALPVTSQVPCLQDVKCPLSRQLVRQRALFDDMSSSLKKAWDSVKLDGKLTPENIKAPMRDIRRALLEADVSLPVVRGFVKRVEARALGVQVGWLPHS